MPSCVGSTWLQYDDRPESEGPAAQDVENAGRRNVNLAKREVSTSGNLYVETCGEVRMGISRKSSAHVLTVVDYAVVNGYGNVQDICGA